jgi:hypothetical protein
MKFTGDEDGIKELKEMKETRMDYLKYILTEVRTNTDNSTTFKSHDVKYKIELDVSTKELKVSKV